MKSNGLKKLLAGISAVCLAASAMPVISCAAEAAVSTMVGDANCDGGIDMSDAVMIMQALSNPNKYGKGGTDKNAITEQGLTNADCNGANDGMSNNDALAIQMYLLGKGQLSSGKTDTPEQPAADAVKIHLKGASIEVEGEYAAVDGTKVTISHSGAYYVDGTLDDGQIEINIPDETADAETVKIFLNNASITGKSAPAVLVTNAKNTSINIVDGTENSLSDGDTAYSGDFAKTAVIEAKDDITIKGGEKGDGVLNITANTQDAVYCNNDIKINGGHINITTSNEDSKTDGIKAKKSVTLKSGYVDIDATGDGIKSSKENVSVEGGFAAIKAGNDAVQAETSIDVSDGGLTAGGDRGLTAVTGINITGGTVFATATDNQVDSTLITTGEQPVLLFNCIDDTSNEKDGTWKKSNIFEWAVMRPDMNIDKHYAEFSKKYRYVLISMMSITEGQNEFVNKSTDTKITYGDDNATVFTIKNGVNIYDKVNPAGMAKVQPNPAPAEFTIQLTDAGIITNASSEAKVENNTCTIDQPGVFTVTGEMKGGQIVVDVDKSVYPDGAVELVLSGMSLTNTDDSPIYVASAADEVVITAKSGTENTVSDGKDYVNADNDTGAIYSKDDIKFKGRGKLNVNGNSADGIVGKDDIKIYNGTLTVNAADNGIRANDSVTVGNSGEEDYSALCLNVNAKSGDGIKAVSRETSSDDKLMGAVIVNGGSVDIEAYADGIQAEQMFVMNSGDVAVKTYTGSSFTGNSSSTVGSYFEGNTNKTDFSAKGIKSVGLYDSTGSKWLSGGDIAVNGGSLNIDSSDDCIHGSGNVELLGGNIKLATADDGIHAGNTLTVGSKNGGFDDVAVCIEKCFEGLEAKKIYQNSGSVIVNSADDGYNSSDGSSGGSNNCIIQINGGFALVNAEKGDHDGFDSNGNLEINGGYVVSNGTDPFDCGEGNFSVSCSGGVWVSTCSAGVRSFGGSELPAAVSISSLLYEGSRLTLADSEKRVIISFIVDRNVKLLKAGGTGVGSGAAFFSGGNLNGSTYFQTTDQSQLAAFGGTLEGGTKLTSS